MKKSMIGMAAAAAVLFGMSACAGKAEKADNAADPAAVETETAEQQEVALEEAPQADPAEVVEEQAEESATEWTTTPSGLKYRVLKQGNGKKPAATDVVLVNYEGKLTNGQKFDSSYDHGQPVSFPLNRVIPGWTEGVQLMPEGSVYEFYIPSDLAYGERGAGAAVPPNSDLIFKVELIKVQ